MGVYSSKAFAGLTILSIVLGVAIVEFAYLGLDAFYPYVRMRPPPFDKIASVVPLDWYVDKLAEKNFTVYLPAELPEKFNLTAVYAVVEESGELRVPTAIVVYSNSRDTNIETAEFALQILAVPHIRYRVDDSSKEWLAVIGNWTAYVNVKASTIEEEYRDKYGTEYGIIIELVIDDLNYQFFFSPVLTLEGAINIVSSMRQARLSPP